jgi:integrase
VKEESKRAADEYNRIHADDLYRRPNKRKSEPARKRKERHEISNKTLHNYYRLFHNIMAAAVRWQYIDKNPVASVKAPKLPKYEAAFYEYEDVKILIDKLQELPDDQLKYKVGIMLTLSTGIRLGELAGLMWECIDLEGNKIHIKKSRSYSYMEGTIEKDPKTYSSIRRIAIPPQISRLLRIYQIQQLKMKLACGELWHDTGYLLVQNNGEPMHPYTTARWFADFIEDQNLKKITFHQLRHTSATLLLDSGLNITALSKRLGHAKTSTTLNIYAHALKYADHEAANAMGTIMFEPKDLVEKTEQTI